MCGIVGIYKRTGIDADAMSKFVDMLSRCQSRGYDATGVVNASMRCIKGKVPSRTFISFPKFKEWADESMGGRFVIGHCRQATRGDPSDNSNNHPIPVIDNGKKVYVVHNGIVSCKKWDLDENKGNKLKEKTDTYIFATAIKSFIDKVSPGGGLSAPVKMAFEDVYKNSDSDSSVIVVADSKEIVICKSVGKPLVVQVVSDGYILFASEDSIMSPVFNGVDENGSRVASWEVLCDHSIVSIDTETGDVSRGLLDTVPKPVPTYEVKRHETVGIVRKCREHPEGGTKFCGIKGGISEYENYVSRKQRRRDRKKKKGHREVEVEEDRFPALSEDEMDDEDRMVLYDDDDGDTDTFNIQCTDCTSCADVGDTDPPTFRSGDLCYCGFLGYEVSPNYAKRCSDFVMRTDYRR